MRVLYVDDDPIMTSAVVRMLESEGFNCDVADLGKTAVDLAKRNKYDIILLDVMLPDIDGYEVIKRLRATGLRTPVLLQSGLVDRENDFEGLWLGASEYLLKPFNKTELVERIGAVLSRKTDKAAPEAQHPSDPSIPKQELEDGRRRHRRFETVQPGRILSNGGIDCLIMDMSYGGASLQLPDPGVEIPQTFDLQLQSGSTLRCNVRWRSGERVGVQGEALFSDDVIVEVLKQSDDQSSSEPGSTRTEPSGPPRQEPETVAAAPAPASGISEPQSGQDSERAAPVQGLEIEAPKELEAQAEQRHQALLADEAPADTRPATPQQPETPTSTAGEQLLAGPEAVSEQNAHEPVVAGGTGEPESPDAGDMATTQRAEPHGRPPPEPAEPAAGSPSSNGHGSQAQRQAKFNGSEDAQVFTVDRGTELVAESCECEELVVDGQLKAAARARRLRLGREGRFAGSAEVEFAEIRGRYEGKLIVTGRLVILAGATVSGTTRYRQIVIEAGGALLGQAQLLPEASAGADDFEAGEQAVAPLPAHAAQG